MRNLFRALRGKPVQLSAKQEAKMAKMQARADAMIAEANANLPPGADPQPAVPSLKDAFKQTVEGFKDALGEMYDDRRSVLDPGDADFNRPIPESEDEAERASIKAAERAARDAARAPFLAPNAPQVVFTRFATTGRAQFEDVAKALQATGFAARPDLVYGVYRVPDRFDHNRAGEGKAYVEWEIAHGPDRLPPATDEVLTTAFRRDAHWVARQPGDPSILDEDLPGVLAGAIGLGPEQCFGVSRSLQIVGTHFDHGLSFGTYLDGSLLITRALPEVAQGHRELMASAPFSLPPVPQLPYFVEVLDWEAAAAWVSPYRWGPARVPSPLPHLPSTWQELMTAYLQVVGVRSEDCYGVQVTRGREGFIPDLSIASASNNFRRKPKLPCADGALRAREAAAELVVAAYRDRPEYEQGRARWRAYQQEVLRARLDHRTGARPAIEVNDRPRPSFASEVLDMFNPLNPMVEFPQLFNRSERPSLGPYCGTLP